MTRPRWGIVFIGDGLIGVDDYIKNLDKTKITRSGEVRNLLDAVDIETLKDAYYNASFGI